MYSHKLNYTKKQTARTQIKVCHDIFTFYWWGLIHNNNKINKCFHYTAHFVSNIMYKLNSVFLWTSLNHFYFIPVYLNCHTWVWNRSTHVHCTIYFEKITKLFRTCKCKRQTTVNHFLEPFCIILKMHELTF